MVEIYYIKFFYFFYLDMVYSFLSQNLKRK